MQNPWLMYLRKSRQDDPHETVEEVLSKHETMLQEYAKRELGYEIPEENIYREVISGESIDEREEIKEVLSRIESADITGVLVIEPSRLSRGDLSDCARIIDAFRFTHTVIATPLMTYNLEKKMERKFFKDELLRGNDYLEYTKEILFRGRVAAAKRGCYINANPPYGYNRIKIGRDWTLEQNENADVVRMIFDWYVNEGITPGAIVLRLNNMGIPAPRGGQWERFTILTIVDNVHYTGKIRFCAREQITVIEDGERVKKSHRRNPEEIIISEGKHDAIIDTETFERAQDRRNSNPRIKNGAELKNPLAGVLVCKKCGKVMRFREKTRSVPRFCCPQMPACSKTAKVEEVIPALISVLEKVNLPELEEKIKNGDGDAVNIQKRRLAKLNAQMKEYLEQEDNQYDLLEKGKYTQDLFDRRNASLRAKIEECEKEIDVCRSSMPKNVNYEEKLSDLKKAIAILKDPNATPASKNEVVRKIIDTVYYTSEDGGFNVTNVTLYADLKL